MRLKLAGWSLGLPSAWNEALLRPPCRQAFLVLPP